MTIYHVHYTCAPDYLARRLPFRPAHLRQLASLREQGLVVAGGPEPDGTAAHIFYRVPDRVGLDRLIEQNEFNRAGLFVANHPRAFVEFVEPVDPPPLDAGLTAMIVEGRADDPIRACSGLMALQQDKRLAFGGLLDGGAGLAVLRSANADEAIGWLAGAGGWDRARLSARAWSQTL